jgi:AraC family transcriptional regulator, regulatory protein of adaptative response / methylated-DNA-[protein]-cysteine methyltransferase
VDALRSFRFESKSRGVEARPHSYLEIIENSKRRNTMTTSTRSQVRATATGDTREILRYGYGKSTLGCVLVASSAKGVAAILIGDNLRLLIEELRTTFPNAILRTGNDNRLVGRVVRLIEDPSMDFDVALDVRGTSFQRKVWSALRTIPAGATRTYSELAARIGEPGAVRAVASACASNKLAVVVPCHRALRNDGFLSGYRWGVDRKRALIEREAALMRN